MRKSLIALIALSGVAVGVAVAQVDGWTDLTGSSLTITGKMSYDPPPDQKVDRVGLHLSGEAAKRIYDAMPAKAEKSGCDENIREKRAGALECLSYKDGDHAWWRSCSPQDRLSGSASVDHRKLGAF